LGWQGARAPVLDCLHRRGRSFQSAVLDGHGVSDSKSRASRVTPVGLGIVVWFVVGVHLVRWIRPLLLLDPEPSWALPRWLLGLFVVAAATCAAGVAAGGFFLWSRSWLEKISPVPLSWRGRTLALVATACLIGGAVLRLADLGRVPASLWVDDLSMIAPALELKGQPSDFADSIRPAPFGVPKPYGSVGVLYLEIYRAALLLFGTNVFGVRFLAAAAGVCSIGTALLLGRALLPRGGGTLAALILAGLRWNLLLSRWGWVALALAPVLDVAALLLLAARRRESLGLALLAGLTAGLGAHFYLAAWVAAAALTLLAAWPRPEAEFARPRIGLAAVYTLGFGLAVAPLFLLHRGRAAPYFARASDHNVLREIRSARSPMPLLSAAADSLASPWFKADPFPHHDLPGRARLDWILGVTVAVALAHALASLRREASAYFLSHGAAALAASIVGGQAGVPNGFRFAYLGSVTAVAAASGVLLLLSLVAAARRREAELAAFGLLVVGGALGARDALFRWPERVETFNGFHGQDTLIARSVLRWDRYGTVVLTPGLLDSPIAFDAIRRYRLDPEISADAQRGDSHATRAFRVVAPNTPTEPGERPVEQVRDVWGRSWAVVVGKSAKNG
jgi:hypothetical protein